VHWVEARVTRKGTVVEHHFNVVQSLLDKAEDAYRKVKQRDRRERGQLATLTIETDAPYCPIVRRRYVGRTADYRRDQQDAFDKADALVSYLVEHLPIVGDFEPSVEQARLWQTARELDLKQAWMLAEPEMLAPIVMRVAISQDKILPPHNEASAWARYMDTNTNLLRRIGEVNDRAALDAKVRLLFA
jgi:hypothetical protein